MDTSMILVATVFFLSSPPPPLEYILKLHSSYSRRSSSSNYHSLIPYSWYFKLEPLITICPSLDHSTSSEKAHGPIYDFGPLSLQ